MERIAWPPGPHRARASQINRAHCKYLCLQWWAGTGTKFVVMLGTGPGVEGVLRRPMMLKLHGCMGKEQ